MNSTKTCLPSALLVAIVLFFSMPTHAQPFAPVEVYLEVVDPQPYYEEFDIISVRLGIRGNVDPVMKITGYNMVVRSPLEAVSYSIARSGTSPWGRPIQGLRDPDEDTNQRRQLFSSFVADSLNTLPSNPVLTTIEFLVEEEVGMIHFDLEVAFPQGNNENLIGEIPTDFNFYEIPFTMDVSGASNIRLGMPTPSPTPTPTPTPSPTPSPSATVSPTPSPSPSPSATPSPTPSPSPSPSVTPTPTATPTPTSSPSPTPTASPSPTPSPSATPSPTPSPTPVVYTRVEVIERLLNRDPSPGDPDRNGDGIIDAADLVG